jgi:hypothetical protein
MTYFYYKCRSCGQGFKSAPVDCSIFQAGELLLGEIKALRKKIPAVTVHQCEPGRKVALADLQFARWYPEGEAP